MANRELLYKELREGIHTLKFTKANGEEVTRAATLDPQHFPQQDPVDFDEVQKEIDEGKSRKRKVNENVVHYYDLTQNGWRSFRVDRFVSLTPAD